MASDSDANSLHKPFSPIFLPLSSQSALTLLPYRWEPGGRKEGGGKKKRGTKVGGGRKMTPARRDGKEADNRIANGLRLDRW